jgi:hypothetical protein
VPACRRGDGSQRSATVWVVRMTGRRDDVIGTAALEAPGWAECGCGSRARWVRRRQVTLSVRAAPLFEPRVARGGCLLLVLPSRTCGLWNRRDGHAGGDSQAEDQTGRQKVGRRMDAQSQREVSRPAMAGAGETVSLAQRLSGGSLDSRPRGAIGAGLPCSARLREAGGSNYNVYSAQRSREKAGTKAGRRCAFDADPDGG